MDEISKENILNPEAEVAPEVLVPQENVEAEVMPESSSQEFGEVPNSQQVSNQGDDTQIITEETYPEEEISQQVSDIAHLPEEEKLIHLKEIAQKDSILLSVTNIL